MAFASRASLVRLGARGLVRESRVLPLSSSVSSVSSNSSSSALRPQFTRPSAPMRRVWKQAYFENQKKQKAEAGLADVDYIADRAYEDDNPDEEDGWRFQVGIVLQRMPLLFAEAPAFHAQYKLFEYDRGLKAGEYAELPPELREGWVDPNARKRVLDDDDQKRKTEEELLLPPKLTPADYHQNNKHLYRKLQNSLYLIVRNKVNKKWVFPTLNITGERSPMRLLAERNVTKLLGRKLRVAFVGNKPIGYLREKAELATAASKGSKTFFFHTLYAVDQVDSATLLSSGYDDYRWLTPAELQEYLEGDLKSLAAEMIMPEEFEVATAEQYGYEWDKARGHYRGVEPEAYMAVVDKVAQRTVFPYPEGHNVKPAMTTRPLAIHGFPDPSEDLVQ